MAREISVTENIESVRSCNGCGAANFDSTIGFKRKKVDRLWDLNIGSAVLALCDDCLVKIIAECSAALANAKENETEE